jgi:hypothetical protein
MCSQAAVMVCSSTPSRRMFVDAACVETINATQSRVRIQLTGRQGFRARPVALQRQGSSPINIPIKQASKRKVKQIKEIKVKQKKIKQKKIKQKIEGLSKQSSGWANYFCNYNCDYCLYVIIMAGLTISATVTVINGHATASR